MVSSAAAAGGTAGHAVRPVRQPVPPYPPHPRGSANVASADFESETGSFGSEPGMGAAPAAGVSTASMRRTHGISLDITVSPSRDRVGGIAPPGQRPTLAVERNQTPTHAGMTKPRPPEGGTGFEQELLRDWLGLGARAQIQGEVFDIVWIRDRPDLVCILLGNLHTLEMEI